MGIAAAYIRVSTDDQLEYSPDSQLKMIREYAHAHGLSLPDALIFREADGVSGRSVKKRPEFQRMIAAARNPENQIDAILVWKFSRFARNQEESIVYKSLLRRERNIPVISVSEPIDTNNEFGALMERIIEWMDGYYSTRLSGEVKRGMAERFSRGEPVSIAPFGYRIEQGNLVIDAPRAETVRTIFEKFAAGAGCRAICRYLNDLGICTSCGNPWEDRAVEYILRNPIYIGKLRWNPAGKTGRRFGDPSLRIVDGRHQPLIDHALWNQVQARISAYQNLYPSGKQQPHTIPLLHALLRCSSCGKALTVSGAGYQCSGYIHGKCTVSHYVSIPKLDSILLHTIREELKNLKLCFPAREPRRQDTEQRLLLKQLDAARASLLRVRTAYEGGIDTLEEYRANKSRIECQIKRLEGALHGANKASPLLEDRQQFQPPAEGGRSTAVQNRLLHLLIHHIAVDREHHMIEIFYFS